MSRTRAGAWVLVGVAGTVLVLVLVAAVATIVSNTSATRSNQRTNSATLNRIKGCTTVGHKCFERGQRATAKAVADINRVAVFAAACADLPGRQSAEQIEACVRVRLATAAKRRTP